jgi:hypothetical protein
MRRTDASVEGFLAQVRDERRREDARRLCALMQEITDEPPVMWEPASHLGASTWSSIWLASSRAGIGRYWRGWVRTRPGRAACTSSALTV